MLPAGSLCRRSRYLHSDRRAQPSMRNLQGRSQWRGAPRRTTSRPRPRGSASLRLRPAVPGRRGTGTRLAGAMDRCGGPVRRPAPNSRSTWRPSMTDAATCPDIVPVILSAGSGTALWPFSRPDHPKPFQPLAGAHSLFQDTVARVGDPAGGPRRVQAECGGGAGELAGGYGRRPAGGGGGGAARSAGGRERARAGACGVGVGAR